VRDLLEAAIGRSPADYTDIRFHRRQRTIISCRGSRTEFVADAEDAGGLVRCLYRGHGWGATEVRDPGQLTAAVQQAAELSLLLRIRDSAVLAPVPVREASFPCPADGDPRGTPLIAKRRLAASLAQAIGGFDRRIVEVRVRYEDRLEETWLGTSEGIALHEARSEQSLAACAVAVETGTAERATDSVATAGSWTELERWAEGARRIADRAIARLHAAPAKSGRLPVILDPRFAAVWVHRALGHRCCADAGGAPRLALGTRIGPEILGVGDDGTALGLRGTLAFDHEGAVPQNTVLVRNGVLVHHLHTRATAQKDGAAPTGNARAHRCGFPSARLTNTYLANGRGTLEDLLRGVSLGVYLAEPESAALEGDGLAIRAGFARMIRRGELAEPLKGVALTGDALGLFGLVDAVAGDFAWDPSASRCERAGGDDLPASHGAPHVRLVEAAIGEAA
jgi:TldD protein